MSGGEAWGLSSGCGVWDVRRGCVGGFGWVFAVTEGGLCSRLRNLFFFFFVHNCVLLLCSSVPLRYLSRPRDDSTSEPPFRTFAGVVTSSSPLHPPHYYRQPRTYLEALLQLLATQSLPPPPRFLPPPYSTPLKTVPCLLQFPRNEATGVSQPQEPRGQVLSYEAQFSSRGS